MSCVLLGAFGGAARDAAIALDLLDPSKRVPRGEQSPTYGPSLGRVAALRDSIPGALRPALMALADDDRGEPMAYDVADALDRWAEIQDERSRLVERLDVRRGLPRSPIEIPRRFWSSSR